MKEQSKGQRMETRFKIFKKQFKNMAEQIEKLKPKTKKKKIHRIFFFKIYILKIKK